MKVTLDLTRLLHEGKISREEFDRFSRFAAADTSSLAFNILVGLGVVAVGGAAVALVPTPMTGIVIGALLMALGLVLLRQQPSWLVLANICVLVAALMLGGGILLQAGASVVAFLGMAAIFLAAALLAKSGLLVALAVTAIAGALGGDTNYWHATYELSIEQPTLTIAVFSSLALAAYWLSNHCTPDFERLATVAARISVFFVNFGFWIGSLWGDRLAWLKSPANPSGGETAPQAFVPPLAFALGWAVALLAVGIWATRENRRWAVNLVAVFGAIHFYTQWFEHLDATPLSVLVAGLLTLGLALALWKWNQRRAAAAG